MVVMQEAFAGIRVVKTHAREDYEAARFNEANLQMLRFVMRWRKAQEIVTPLVETVASLGIVGALVYAWYYELGVGQILRAAGRPDPALRPGQGAREHQFLMQKCLAATTKVFELLDRAPAIQDAPGARPLREVRGEMRLRECDLRLSRQGRAGGARASTLACPPGRPARWSARRGAGKSTLFWLLQRLYEPQTGRDPHRRARHPRGHAGVAARAHRDGQSGHLSFPRHHRARTSATGGSTPRARRSRRRRSWRTRTSSSSRSRTATRR